MRRRPHASDRSGQTQHQGSLPDHADRAVRELDPRNGDPFDPWIRIHTRRGGQIVKPIPHSMRNMGTVAEWEEWTGMRFPGDGAYTFPAGLATVEIDHPRDRGAYGEPNVWIVHTL